MNKFCWNCHIGGKYKLPSEIKNEIRGCKDRKCPFHRHRFYNLEYQEKRK